MRIQEVAGRIPCRFLPRRLGRSSHHRPDRHFPGRPHAGAHLFQRGPALRPGAADLLLLGPSARRRPTSRLLRRGDHGRGQRLDVSRFAAHGRGVVGEKVSLEVWVALHARPRAVRRCIGGGRQREAIEFARAYFASLPQRTGKNLQDRGEARTHRSERPPWGIVRSSQPRLRHAQADSTDHRRGQLARDQKLFAKELLRLRPPRRTCTRDLATADAEGAACSSAIRRTRRRASSGFADAFEIRCSSSRRARLMLART